MDVFSVGGWTDFEEFKIAWQNAQPARVSTWYDCHAWEPSFAPASRERSMMSNLKRWTARLAPRRAK